MENIIRLIEEFSQYVRELKAAQTRETIGEVYSRMVGYDIAQDMPEASFEELQNHSLDYIREVCEEYDINPLDVDLEEDETDDYSRSYGPHASYFRNRGEQ